MKKVKVERNYADFLLRTGKANYKLEGTPTKDFAVLTMSDADAFELLRKGGNIIEVIDKKEAPENKAE